MLRIALFLLGEFSLLKFYYKHMGISFGFVLSIIIVLLYLFSLSKEELWVGAEKWFSTAFQIAIGYIINFIFYITQVYLPQIKEEKEAFILFEYDFYKLTSLMDRLYSLVEAFVTIKGDVINYKRGIICFKNEPDVNKKFYHVDIDKALKRVSSKIDDTINNMVNNKAFIFCDKWY